MEKVKFTKFSSQKINTFQFAELTGKRLRSVLVKQFSCPSPVYNIAITDQTKQMMRG